MTAHDVLKPRWHGNGFVQVYLNPLTRLHVWNPDLQATRVVNAQIHDHKFTFVSRVLVGKLMNRVWRVQPAREGLLRRSRTYCGTYDKARSPTVINERVDIEHVVDRIFQAGETYEFGGPDFYHETICKEYTVTVMTKVHVVKDHFPLIVSPWGQLPDHAHNPDTAPSEERLKAEVLRALTLIGTL